MLTSKDGKKYECECGKSHGIMELCLKSSESRQGWVSRKIEDAKPKVEPILKKKSREQVAPKSTARPVVQVNKRELEGKPSNPAPAITNKREIPKKK